MPGPVPSAFDIWTAIRQLIFTDENLRDTVRQMSFGLIQIAPPPGDPSLTSQMNNIVFQIQSLREHLDIANSEMISQNVDILAALAALPDGTSPVVLPTTPPAGYLVSNSDIANEVWLYGLPSGAGAGDALNDVYASTQALGGNTFITIPGYPWMAAQSLDNWQDLADQALGPPAVLDASTILPSDGSILAWANRAHHGPAGWTSSPLFGHNTPRQVDDNTPNVRWWITMTPAEFADHQAVTTSVLVPPIWPGFAGVTLGTAVALSTGVSIIADMDGVLIDIAGVPTRANFYDFDGAKSYRNLGALTFFDDNGDFEYAQTISFESQILTPRTMKRAGGVKLRTVGGVSGTIRPWTINP